MEPQPVSPPRRPRSWIWFFAAVLVLTILATVSLYLYSVSTLLKPETLAAAEKLWQEKGPRSYLLVYSTYTSANPQGQRFVVQVKDGRVESLTLDGRPLEKRLYARYGMTALFHDVEEFQEEDKEPGKPRAYTRAYFDEQDGHLRWYLRSVTGTKQRLEIRVDEFKPLP